MILKVEWLWVDRWFSGLNGIILRESFFVALI